MKLKKLSITNVKSFNSPFEVEFKEDFNIIVGPNASGKSNLLDIVTICLRKFFIWTHTFQDQGEGRKIIRPQMSFQDNVILDKYSGNDGASTIEFVFSFQQGDLENLNLLREKRDDFLAFLQVNSYNDNSIEDIVRDLPWDDSDFSIGDELSYRITDGNLHFEYNYESEDADHLKTAVFLNYLRFWDAFCVFYSEYLGFSNPAPIFLFLSAYRAVSQDDGFQGNLSVSTPKDASLSLLEATSKTPMSLINMASLYFARKKRSYETKAMDTGYRAEWENDKENVLITKYLHRMGYTWDLKLVNSDNNTYEIELIKDGLKLGLSQASSGEKEIINYLFGIFALKIRHGLIVIDEPELHLHPRWQRLLLDLFLELTDETGNQFIITTHSPVFIQTKTLSNLIRVFKKDAESKYISLKDSESTNLKDLLHIVNTTNNEKIFFADAVVLVEGITDRLVFQKLIQAELDTKNQLYVIEVVDINGKNNIHKFRDFLGRLAVPNFFIADLDYVTDIGDSVIKGLFQANKGKIGHHVFKNKYSLDKRKLIDVLDEAIETTDLTTLKDFVAYIKSFRQELKDETTGEERARLKTFIEEQKTNGDYILANGDIENYFPDELNSKNLDNVLVLLSDNGMQKWKVENPKGLSSLTKIAKEIVGAAIN